MQKADLARMYRLFNRVDKGLEPVAAMFKKHVEAQGVALVKQVTDAMDAKKAKDAGEQQLHNGALLLAAVSREKPASVSRT